MAVSSTTSKQTAAFQAVEAARKIAKERVSPVQQKLQVQAEEKAKTTGNNYFESEDFLRLKAFELRSRIVLYKNLGLNAEYQQAQQESAEVIKKYQALLKKGLIGNKTDTSA